MKNCWIICVLAISFLFIFGACNQQPKDFPGYMNQLADIMLENDGDCSAMAKKLDAWIDKNGDAMSESMVKFVTDAVEKGEKLEGLESQLGFPKAKQEKLDNLKCKDNEDVKKVEEKLEKVMEKATEKMMGAIMKAAMKEGGDAAK